MSEQINNGATRTKNRLIEYVDHVQLPVNNIEKGTEWYSRVLGLEVMAPGWLKFAQGPLLMLHHSSKDTKVSWLSEDDFPMPAFMFLTKNIEALHAALTDNNSMIRMYQDEGFGWVIKFVDPFGNELGAYAPKE
ncbi:VOC family protein [Paenibacillus ginsengarvi]|uniref:VOC family protein n=1 Tax=Paenibacillus ginsengarvi TaxID=400777 RepID=A0A3B0CKM6_9BACL|nr:VOC family protein [Paenibacillus ginsengarvi]RKN85772.1 VOC family protein [Paenibacillus ginsengarvi]